MAVQNLLEIEHVAHEPEQSYRQFMNNIRMTKIF
jgi:hypothetical protein